MKRTTHRLLLASFLAGAVGSSACSSSTNKATGTGGTGGMIGVGGLTSNGGNSAAGVGGAEMAGGSGTGGSSGSTNGGATTGGDAGAAGHTGVATLDSSTPFVRWAFDTLDGWAIKPADSFIPLRIDAAAGTTFTATGGVAVLTVPFGASSNAALQTTAIQHVISPTADMTDLTLTLKIRWVSGGVGTAPNADGGFDVYLIPSDAAWTEGVTGRGEFTLADRGVSAFKQFTYTIPTASATWNPTSIQQLQVRIDSKFWVGSTFDYTTAVFDIESISY